MFGKNTKVDLELNREVEQLLKTGGKEQILYLLNTRDESKRLRLSAEVVKGAKAMRDLLTGERVTVNGDGEFILPAPGITGRFLLLEP